MFHIPAHKSILDTKPAASGEPADLDPMHLSRILHEMAGAVSMCWEPRPSGVFESSLAAGYVADAIAEIRSRMPAVSGEPVHQWRKAYCADWYDGHPDNEDGGGPYETRTLYTAACHPERIARLLDALDQAQKDAARYLWVRQADNVRMDIILCVAETARDVDAAIDAAMAQSPEVAE